MSKKVKQKQEPGTDLIKSVEDSIRNKITEVNEYGYRHQAQNPEELDEKEMNYLRGMGLKETYTYNDGTLVPIHPACINCQARHLIKYKNNPSVENKNVFDIRCKGIPGAMPVDIRPMIQAMATKVDIPEDRAELVIKAAHDPVAWAELMLGFRDGTDWQLRWYQKEVLRCSSNRMVTRMGRRTGKTFSMAVKLLYLMFNHKVYRGVDSEGREIWTGPEIIISTPFQSQVDNVFAQIEVLLKRNIDLVNQISTKHAGNLYIKSPFYLMEFSNGGSISGFVTGVEIRTDGSAGGSLRGQSGHILYVDEMDMIPTDVLEKVIMPILLTAPNTMFFATSTPIGKAGKFYDLCRSRPDFKEMWLPSTVIPHWESDGKKEVSNMDTQDDGFIAEYMAEFVESGSGVFKAEHIYRAMKNYEYRDADPDNSQFWNGKAGVRNRATDLVTVIGIDWNKNAGSEFVVVRYDQEKHRWWVAEAVNIPAGKFDSIVFKQEVWRLNFKWKPDYIYADEGYGHHIIDDIHYEAHRLRIESAQQTNKEDAISLFDQQRMKLGDRLKKFNFAQKVELRNPVDGTPFERTGKEFIVENAIRVFEEGAISFPASDATLRNQMLNYIVIRRHASNGRPVYGMKQEKIGDHRLDALMLALAGIFLERNKIYSPRAMTAKSAPELITKDALEKRRANHEIEGNPALKIGGVGKWDIDEWKIQRGNSPEEDAYIRNLQKLEQSLNEGKLSGKRGDFPTGKSQYKEKSAFEELWERTKGSSGYDDDTRAIYEAKALNRQRSSSRSNNGGLSIARKPKIGGRGSRSGGW